MTRTLVATPDPEPVQSWFTVSTSTGMTSWVYVWCVQGQQGCTHG